MKLIYFFLKSSSQLTGIDQTNGESSNNDQGRVYQNCEFHDPGAGLLVLGSGQNSHTVKIPNFIHQARG